MLAQMCDAVAACHAVGFFIGILSQRTLLLRMGGIYGLLTREEECSDIDCGSAPYMKYGLSFSFFLCRELVN